MNLKKIKDLFLFKKGIVQSTKAVAGEYDFITAASEWKTHNVYTHDCEALVFAAAAAGSLGRTHYVDGKFVASDLCFIITPKDTIKYPVNLKFYHLVFEALKDEIVRNTKSGTSKEAIGLSVFGNYEVPYFDISKQVEIKEKLIDAQDLSHRLSCEFVYQLESVRQLRQAFLREAMKGLLITNNIDFEHASVLLERIRVEKKRLIKDLKIKKQKPLLPIRQNEIPFEVPKNWAWCRLGEIASLITSGSRNWNKFYSNSGALFIRSQNIKKDSIDLNNVIYVELPKSTEGKRTAVEQMDILITITGAGVSNSALLHKINFKEGYVSQHISLVRLVEVSTARWVHRTITSDIVGKEQFSKLIYGDKPGLNLDQINNLAIPIPPISEQQQIASKLDELMNYCDELETGIKDSQKQNGFTMQKATQELLGILYSRPTIEQFQPEREKLLERKFESNTIQMELMELLEQHGRLHAEELWRMSKFYNLKEENRDIDGFYAELKKQIEVKKVVKESKEKGYLELV